jgi:betaine-aldehyde dehydrogenase
MHPPPPSLSALASAGRAAMREAVDAFASAASRRRRPIRLMDPSSGLPSPSPCPQSSRADVDAAVASARACMASSSSGPTMWRDEDRASALEAVSASLLSGPNVHVLAAVESISTGKPLREARADVEDAAACFRYAARLARGSGVTPPRPHHVDLKNGATTLTASLLRMPVGVVAAVTPWNYPLMMAAWKVAPALAAGCAVVLKPSEFTPHSSLLLAALAAPHLPRGALTVLCGRGDDVGRALCAHPGVDKVTFTGSGATGRRVMRAAADGTRRVTLELGGKSPAVVLPGADVEAAADWIACGSFVNAGQICSATSRVIVHSSRLPELRERLAALADGLVLGGPFGGGTGDGEGGRHGEGKRGSSAEGPDMGPLVTAKQRNSVRLHITRAQAEGARVVAGGAQAVPASRFTSSPSEFAGGHFVLPTVLDRVTPAHAVWREEIFGPVVTLTPYETEAEAVALANDTQFGLAAAVFGGEGDGGGGAIARVRDGIRAGYVWENCSQPAPHSLPWGGMKRSGLGRELGEGGLAPFLESKSVVRFGGNAGGGEVGVVGVMNKCVDVGVCGSRVWREGGVSPGPRGYPPGRLFVAPDSPQFHSSFCWRRRCAPPSSA